MRPSELGGSERFGRRDVLKLAGASAAGGAIVTGTGSAHTSECVYFCGCGRMTAYDSDGFRLTEDSYPVLVGKEGGGPGPAGLEDHQVPVENEALEFTQRGRGKILAVIVGGEIYYNPNECAQKVFEEHSDSDTDTPVEDTVNQHFESSYGPSHPGLKGHCHPPDRSSHDH